MMQIDDQIYLGIKNALDGFIPKLGGNLADTLLKNNYRLVRLDFLNAVYEKIKSMRETIIRLNGEILDLTTTQCPYADTDNGVYCDEYGDNHKCATIDGKLQPKESQNERA